MRVAVRATRAAAPHGRCVSACDARAGRNGGVVAGLAMQVLCIIRRSIQPDQYLSKFGFAGDWLLGASLTVHMDSGLRVVVSES